MNKAWILVVCSKAETENLLVPGRSRHFSETFMLSSRGPSPLPHPRPWDDAWGVEQPTNENKHYLCRDGFLVWGYNIQLPIQFF